MYLVPYGRYNLSESPMPLHMMKRLDDDVPPGMMLPRIWRWQTHRNGKSLDERLFASFCAYGTEPTMIQSFVPTRQFS